MAVPRNISWSLLELCPRDQGGASQAGGVGISVEGTTHRGSRNRQSLPSSALLGRSHGHLEWSFANIKVHRDHLGDRVQMQILTQGVWGGTRDAAFVTKLLKDADVCTPALHKTQGLSIVEFIALLPIPFRV